MTTKKEAKMIYKAVGFSLIALCFVLSFVYRPYAYSHHLNDFHLSDSYTSFFGIPIGVCLTQAYRSESWSIPKNILYVALLLIGWELVDGFLAKKFDWVDISACIISGCLMYVLYLIFGFKRVVDYDLPDLYNEKKSIMKKNDILSHFGVESLSAIKDEDLIEFAEEGKLGEYTMWSAVGSWMFPNKKALADHIRKAIEMEKELRTSFIDGEWYCKDQVIIEFV